MLSTENPPSDLSQNTSNTNISSDDASKLADLLTKSNFDDNKFSIRGYVFNSRAKDIKTNWPFSEKNLKLCLNHGVKNVLPPFQSLDSIRRNPSAVENICSSDVSHPGCSSYSDVGEKLAVNVENINSSGSEENKELPPSKTTSPCSDINLPGFSTEKKLNKLESDNPNRVKKCKLLVKLSNIGEPSSKNQVLGLDSCVVSEAMASKVCPVCKTFSSSSNTTLNAHIDQCLSAESTHVVKATPDSRVVRHRIKPRKTRLMVDIYSKALHCTLEDLDKRNGTNWASNLGPQAPDLEDRDEDMTKKYPSVNIEENNEEGAVYIDSKGRKLRILSKFGDPPLNSSSKDDCEPSKLVKKDFHGSKFISGKKKKYLVQKHKLSSPGSEHDPEQIEFPSQEDSKKEDSIDQMKSDDLGMIKKWVVSKRTGLKKKTSLEHEQQYPNDTTTNLRTNSGDTSSKRTRDSNSPISFDENPLLTKKRDNLLCDSEDESEEQPSVKKRRHFSLMEPQEIRVKKKKEDGTLVRKRFMDPTKKGDRSLISSKKTQRHNTFSFRGKEIASPKKTSSDHGISPGVNKSSLLRKNLLSVPDSKKNLKRKHLNFKKPRLHYTSGSEEEETIKPQYSKFRQEMKGAGESSSYNRKRFSEIRKKRRQFSDESEDEGEEVSKSSDTSESDSHDFTMNVDSPEGDDIMFGTSDVIKETEIQKSTSDHISDREAFIAFSKSLDSAFTDIPGPSEAQVVKETDIPNERGDQVNYFVDVDPIPIPGPPGSFLPSPGRMGSEELQGNSSLTTCKIQSSEDEHGWVDNNIESSDSPISATTSMVSNTIDAVSNLPIKSNVGQHDSQFAPVVFPEMSSVRFKNSQPCCCSRKEGPGPGPALYSGSLKHEESQILRRRAMNSLPFLAQQQQTCEHEKNVRTSSVGHDIPRTSEAKISTCGVCESPSPSVSTPVLRLMGKNLIVNKDENMSPQSVANGNMQNLYEHHSFHHTPSRAPSSMFDNMQTSMPVQHFDFSSRPQQFSQHNSFGGNFTTFLNPDQLGSKVMRSQSSSYNRPLQDYSGSNHKDIIVINDSPQSESGLGNKSAGGSSSVGIFGSVPMALGYESRDYNRFSNYQTIGYPIYGNDGSRLVQNAQTIGGGMNPNMVRYKNFPPQAAGSSSVQVHPSSLSGSSPASKGHLRSSLYFSPGF